MEPIKVYSETGKALFERIFIHYLDEANHTLELLQEFSFSRKEVILEMGGGLGLTYGFLKSQGYAIYAIEPSSLSYPGFYETANKIFSVAGIEPTTWYPYTASEVHRIPVKADFIYSHNVLEHIADLTETFTALKTVLAPNGIMVHTTTNYLIPFDPHFEIPLVPVFPRLTSLFFPFLRNSNIWKELNFVTPFSLQRAARKSGLKITFKKGVLLETLRRLEKEHEFATRHKRVAALYRRIKKYLNILSLIPAQLNTPTTFFLEDKLRVSRK